MPSEVSSSSASSWPGGGAAPLDLLEDIKVALVHGDATAVDRGHAVALLKVALSILAPLPLP
eukprot:13173064-Alexandrium_andersonii.AAC.1